MCLDVHSILGCVQLQLDMHLWAQHNKYLMVLLKDSLLTVASAWW